MFCSRWHEKVNFVDSRLRSAEHSSELDALLSLARELRLSKRRGLGRLQIESLKIERLMMVIDDKIGGIMGIK